MRRLFLEVALLAFPPAVFAQTQTALAQENQVSSSTQSYATGVDSVKEDSSKYWKRFSLQEVTVKAQRKLIKNDIDRLSYDVQHDNDSKTQNTLEMLRKVPMV